MASSALTPLRIGIVAAEPSGDILAAGLMRALRAKLPDVEFWGIGGERMQAEGITLFAPMEAITMMGLEAGVTRIASIWLLRRRFITQAPQAHLDAFIGVDAPDFNLLAETVLKQKGVPTVHYVSPTVWAWRGYRVKKIQRAADRILTLFPFEQSFYEARNMSATYVGHPAAKVMSAMTQVSARAGLAKPDDVLIALLPGSRYSEVSRLLPPMLEAAELLSQRYAGLRFVLPIAKPGLRADIEAALHGHSNLNIQITEGDSRRILKAADATLIASGTATLEALLAGTPMVVVYQVSKRTEWLVKRLGQTDYYSLPNHLLPEPMVPELIQDAVTGERIASELETYLQNEEKTQSLKSAFSEVAEQLDLDSDRIAAEAVLAQIGVHQHG